MIPRLITPATALYRAHVPKWASLPESGAGAAQSGGRFNRPTVEAVYLSLDPTTALAEYQQTSPFLPPTTVVEYQANAKAVDLAAYMRNPNDPAWDALWWSWNVDWRDCVLTAHVEPPTWVLGDMAIAAGYNGILFPSTLPGCGENVVLYPATFFASGATLTCIDPGQLLPRNRSSWEP